MVVGTLTERVPYKKRVLVDNGHWETTYRTERVIVGYRNKKILSHYKRERYVKAWRWRSYRGRYGYTYRREPVYGYRSVPVYETIRVPVYGVRKVPSGRRWVSKWEWEEITAYRLVQRPIYEEQWVTVGMERIPEEQEVEEKLLAGYEWRLVDASETQTPDIIQEMTDLRTDQLGVSWQMSTAFSLTLRAGPGHEHKVLGYIPYGSYLLWSGISQTVDGTTWYKVRYRQDGEILEGWVSSAYLIDSVPGTTEVRFEEQMLAVFERHGTRLG